MRERDRERKKGEKREKDITSQQEKERHIHAEKTKQWKTVKGRRQRGIMRNNDRNTGKGTE